MKLTRNLLHLWHDRPITTKFTLGIGLLLALIVAMAAAGYGALGYVRSAELSIMQSRDIQRLVLEMDSNRELAQRLHRDFFLQYLRLGLRRAHELYAQPSVRAIAQAIADSHKLEDLLASSQVGEDIARHKVDLNLYLSTAKRFADTSIKSVELATRLVAPERGLTAELAATLAAIAGECRTIPGSGPIFQQMKSHGQDYQIHKKRFMMQSSLNRAAELAAHIQNYPDLTEERRARLRSLIDRYVDTVEKILAVDVKIKALFNDFALQDQLAAPVAATLVRLAGEDVRRARAGLDSALRSGFMFIVVIALAGLAIALLVALVLHRSITGRVVELTRIAGELHDGNLAVSFPENSNDELGTLARVFNGMTRRMSRDIRRLRATEESLLAVRDGLEDKVARRTAELEKLLNFSRKLAESRELPVLYRACTSLARELLKFDFSTLMILNPDRKSLVIQDTIGLPASTIGTFALVEGQGLSTHVVSKKEAAVVQDFKTEKRFEVPPIVFDKKITSALAVPMMIGDEVFGVFIGHTLARRDFSEAEISLYKSFANQAAIAIANARQTRALIDSEKKFRAFFDNANDAILIYSLEGLILEVNQVLCERLGYTREEFLAMPEPCFVADRFLKKLLERIKKVVENEKEIFESAHIRRDGREIPVELSCTVIDYQSAPAILAIARDITERRRLENEMLKIKKLESLGVLAGGIAHDFNNILAAVLGNINLAQFDQELSDDTRELLHEAERASARARGLTQQLLTFAKGGEPVREAADIVEVIKESARFVLHGSKVSCRYQISPGLDYVRIDRGQISQVVQNLIINARQAMPEGGNITVSCRNIRVPDDIDLPESRPGKFIEIRVADCGIGIPAEIIDRIFDPYYTTKQEGSGLGLAVTHSIISKHNGHIMVESSPGEGAVFTIYLPGMWANLAGIDRDGVPDDGIQTGRGRVMIMDDEEMVQKVAGAMLTRLGYEVVTAADGATAVKLYQDSLRDGAGIKVIIMDLTIPGGMGGKEAVQEILALDPQARVIVSSGYSNDPVMARFEQYGFKGAVAKPFDLKELSRVVKGLMTD